MMLRAAALVSLVLAGLTTLLLRAGIRNFDYRTVPAGEMKWSLS